DSNTCLDDQLLITSYQVTNAHNLYVHVRVRYNRPAMKPRRVPIPLRLLSYAVPYKKRLALAITALTGLTAFQLLGPTLVAYAIDTGIDFDKKTGISSGNVRTILIAAGLIKIGRASCRERV